MTYDFDTVTDRRSTYSSKWSVADGQLPLSTADMDFKTAPEIMHALQNRMEKGVFGYTDIPDGWYDAYVGWWQRRHGFTMEKEWLIFSTGVVPTISSTIRKLTTPNENVVLLTPTYNIFFNSIINNGCRPLQVPLRYESGQYAMDFDALETALRDPQTSMMILCNPHNPVGRIWTVNELAKVGELAAKYSVIVISDEIHCDLTEPGCRYTPFASVNEVCRDNSITCIAPTKTFSLAGLQTSAIAVPNPFLRHKVWRAINTDECGEPNAFAMDATMAAFNEGAGWLDAMLHYVSENKKYIRSYIAAEVPGIKVIDSDATYLLWLDCSGLTDDATLLAECLKRETGLILSDGEVYGKGGECFLRLNTAYPRVQIEDGMHRLKKGTMAFIQSK